MKNNDFRRSISLVVCVIMGVGLLAGCAGNTAVEKESGNRTKVSFSWWGNDDRHQYTLDGVDLFQEQNGDIEVQCRYGVFDGYETRMQVWMRSHTETDVMQINYAWIDKYSSDGSAYYDLYKLADYIEFDNYDEADLKLGEVNGRLNAIPIAYNTETIFINKTIYDKYGLDIPETWDDYFKAAQVMKKDDIYPIGMSKKHMFLLLTAYFEQSKGHTMFNNDGTLNMSKGEVEELLEFYKRLLEEKVILPVDQFDLGKVAKGQIAGCACWVSDAGNYGSAIRNADCEPVIAEYPTANGDLKGWYIKPATLYAISGNTEHPEAAAKLLNFLLNSSDMAMLQKTEKGVPISHNAYETLKNADALDTYQTDASNKMMENRDCMSVMLPVMENEALINAFKEGADEYIYGKKTLDESTEAIYSGMLATYE